MNSNLKISSSWSQLGLLLALLGAALIFTGLIDKGILSISEASASHTVLKAPDPQSVGMMKFIQAISTMSLFLLPAVLFAVFTFRTRRLSALGFHKAEKAVFYGLAVLVMLVAFPLEGWLGELNRNFPLPAWAIDLEKEAEKQISALLKANSFAVVALNVLVIALLPAICEEAFFRGALQRILIGAFRNPWAGIIMTAILFSALHFQFQGFLPRMFLGVVLGALYWYSGSLWVSIAAHFFFNGIQVVAVSLNPDLIKKESPMPVTVTTALISMVLVIALLTLLRKRSTVSYARVYEEEPF